MADLWGGDGAIELGERIGVGGVPEIVGERGERMIGAVGQGHMGRVDRRRGVQATARRCAWGAAAGARHPSEGAGLAQPLDQIGFGHAA